MDIALQLKEIGVEYLRGGAFKPRTTPDTFQGLGKEGLELLAMAKEKTGQKIVTEVMGTEEINMISDYADILQIGSRNMHNYDLLKKVLGLDFDYILIDRTPFCADDRDRLCVQKVPPVIFKASYPAWIFSTSRFKDFFNEYEIVTEFTGFESKAGYGYDFKGFIIKIEKAPGNAQV